MDNVAKIAWYNDYCGVSACFIAVVLFTYCWPITNFVSSKFGALLRRGTADEEEINRLEVELREERHQLGLLSPTAQFAAYFKKDRHVNRLESQYKILVSKRQKATFTTSIVLKALFISLCYVTAVALMFYSRHVQVGTIDCNYFWPFSFLLRTPNIGALEGDTKECPVTLFAVLLLCNFVWRNAASADENKSKQTWLFMSSIQVDSWRVRLLRYKEIIYKVRLSGKQNGSDKERPKPLYIHYFILYGYCGHLEAIKMETFEGRHTPLRDVGENVDRGTSVLVTEGDGHYECWSSRDDLLKMGYKFNAQGRLCDKERGDVVVLGTANTIDLQHEPQVECLLQAVRSEVHSLLVKNFSMNFIYFPSEKGSQQKQNGFLLASTNFATNERSLVVLIEGFGTAGQWDPMLVLSDGLEFGSQMSCISSCIEHGWAVLIIDAVCLCTPHEVALLTLKNSGHIVSSEENCKKYGEYDTTCLHFCWGNCLQKLVHIWERYVLGSSVQKIAIIAHRCGGFLAENILKNATDCGRLKAVCLSDWILSAVPSEAWWHMAIRRTRHWVPSARPCGAREKTCNGVRCVSGGTKDPRKIPALAVGDMIRFIGEMFGNTSGNIVTPPSG